MISYLSLGALFTIIHPIIALAFRKDYSEGSLERIKFTQYGKRGIILLGIALVAVLVSVIFGITMKARLIVLGIVLLGYIVNGVRTVKYAVAIDAG